VPKIERDSRVTSVTSVPSSDKIVGSRVTDRQEYRAHEADIKGKLLNKRQRKDPVKMKMIETSETDIEELTVPTPSSGLPVVDQSPSMHQSGIKSAFVKRDSRDELQLEKETSQDLWHVAGQSSTSSTPRPGSSSSNSGSGQLFKQGKGRPLTRPGSSSSMTSIGDSRDLVSGGGPVSVSGSDSGVEIPSSPGSDSRGFPSLPKVKTKDELLMMLNKIKKDDSSMKHEEMKLEDWK